MQDPLDHFIQQEDLGRLRHAIHRLPETERLVLRCIDLHEMTEEDTSTCSGLPHVEVREALNRARRMLVARLTA